MKQRNTVTCDNCKKDSGIVRGASDGKTAAQLVGTGWSVKLPVLVGITAWFFACSDACMKAVLAAAYREHGVTQDELSKATQITENFKANIPHMAKETADAVERIYRHLLKQETQQ